MFGLNNSMELHEHACFDCVLRKSTYFNLDRIAKMMSSLIAKKAIIFAFFQSQFLNELHLEDIKIISI